MPVAVSKVWEATLRETELTHLAWIKYGPSFAFKNTWGELSDEKKLLHSHPEK